TPARARHGCDDFFSARVGDGAPYRRPDDEPALVAALQRPDRPRLRALSGQLRGRVPAAAVPWRAARAFGPRARAMRQPAWVHRLQPESRSVGRSLDRTAADRSLVVSALREDGRARCA